MEEFKEQSLETLDIELTSGKAIVKIRISTIGVCDDKKDKLFDETKKYKENIRAILNGD